MRNDTQREWKHMLVADHCTCTNFAPAASTCLHTRGTCGNQDGRDSPMFATPALVYGHH